MIDLERSYDSHWLFRIELIERISCPILLPYDYVGFGLPRPGNSICRCANGALVDGSMGAIPTHINSQLNPGS